jgi:hypothetical protein
MLLTSNNALQRNGNGVAALRALEASAQARAEAGLCQSAELDR